MDPAHINRLKNSKEENPGGNRLFVGDSQLLMTRILAITGGLGKPGKKRLSGREKSLPETKI